jgi:4-alpha-glucanotransferase
MASDRRKSGLLLPLFSCPSSESWGSGDIGDVAPMAAWMARAGQRVWQLLPLNEMAAGEQSPYSALSAMAIDPIYISMRDLPEWTGPGGEGQFTDDERAALAGARESRHVDYPTIRRLRENALSLSFARFLGTDWARGTARATALQDFVAQESWWVVDYALFRALHDREERRPWQEWPEPLRRRDPNALEEAHRELEQQVLFYQYLQWIAHTQWIEARAAARAVGVELFGDLPFMVDGHSADVWKYQEHFRLDASVGVPPDAFSATGQDWGMPAYRWERIALDDFRWLRDRARRSAALFGGYRVDHLVGFYRTYSRPRAGGEPSFSPSTEAEQIALGERVLDIFRAPGSEIIAEDLGTVPDFVRESLRRLEIPGYRVFRWEREWHSPGQPFRDPHDYPEISVATSGTHDTETLTVWWTEAGDKERSEIAAIQSVAAAAGEIDLLSAPFNPTVRDVLLEAVAGARSYFLILPFQDVFGWRERINEPATVTPHNWTFRLPWPVDHLNTIAEACERQRALRALSERHGR